jgi:hypothetical protein
VKGAVFRDSGASANDTLGSFVVQFCISLRMNGKPQLGALKKLPDRASQLGN